MMREIASRLKLSSSGMIELVSLPSLSDQEAAYSQPWASDEGDSLEYNREVPSVSP
jgi:hypothetical protein